jgi:hypothetical protein
MHTSAYPSSPTSDATLQIAIPFTAEHGFPYPQTIFVPINFSPPRSLLGLCVALGVVLGALLRMFLISFSKANWNWRTPRTWAWSEFAIGIVIATVSWLMVLLIFRNSNTAVRLFGVTFDPTQLFSAFMLCLLAGGGPTLFKWLKDFFPALPGGSEQ